MASKDAHIKMYESFKRGAENESLEEGPRAEMYFLAAFHLIETCAAKNMVHINKHQLVRKTIEENKAIFMEETEKIWRDFQYIENQLRPKFVYGGSWEKVNFDELKEAFKRIEKICLKVLESD